MSPIKITVEVQHCVNGEHFHGVVMDSGPILLVKGTVIIDTM